MVGGSQQSSSSNSSSQDLTPEAFKRLQEPFADVLGQLLGFSLQPVEGTGTAGTSGTSGSGGRDGIITRRAAGNEGDGKLNTFDTGRSGTPATEAELAFQPTGDPNDPLRGIPTFQGETTAGIGDREQALLDQLVSGDQSASSDLLTRTINGEFLPGEDGSNPFLQRAIEAAQRPTLEALEETLSRTLPGRFTQAGQFTQPQGTSAFDRAAGIATRGAANALGDIASQLSFAGFEAERGRQQEAAGLAPQVTAQEINNTLQNLQAQGLPRMIEQHGLDAGVDAFNAQVTNLLQVLSIATGASAPVIGQQSASKSKGGSASIFGG